MEKEDRIGEDQWLTKLASSYDGNLPYSSETEVILWLQTRAEKTKNSLERKRYKSLIDEAEIFGGSDDWGTLNPELVGFARFLTLLQSRTKND